MIKTLKFILLLTVFLIPLVPASFGFGFELIKVLIFLFLTIISGLIFVYLLFKKKIKIIWSKIKISALVFLVTLTITSFTGINFTDSLIGRYPYYQGLIVYWIIFLFFLMTAEIGVNIKKLSFVITISAIIVSSISILQFIQLNLLGMEIPNYAGRVVSTFGQPNLYSGFLLLALPFVWQNQHRRLILTLIISAGISLSASQAAIILLCVLGLVVLLRYIPYKVLWIFFILVVLLGAIVYSAGNSTGLYWDEVVKPFTKQGTEGHMVEKRIYIIPIMLDIYSGSSVLGYGIDSVNSLYRGYFQDFKPELRTYPPLYLNLMNLTVDRSHNYFLDLLIFSGAPGLIAYFYLLFLLLKSRKPLVFQLFLLSYVVWVQFQVQSIVHLILFWNVAGVIDKGEKLVQDKL